MKTRSVLLLALLLPILACQRQEPVQPTSTASEGDSESKYKLQIVFHGLMGFAREKDKDGKDQGVWAFLVDTEYNADKPNKEDLPPGVFEESRSAAFLRAHYPRHFPEIRITGGTVKGTGCAGSAPVKCKIEGADITFETGVTGLGAVSLGEMSNSALVLTARESKVNKTEIEELEQLDSVLIEPLGKGSLDPRLTARVLINAGDVVAIPWTECGIRTFSYNAPTEPIDGCADPDGPFVTLAEEVIAEQNVVQDVPTVIHLGGGRDIEVKPTSKTVVIEIVNQTMHASSAGDPCEQEEFHGAGFRWLYGLAKGSGSKVRSHFYPCKHDFEAGGDKCPPKSFVVVR